MSPSKETKREVEREIIKFNGANIKSILDSKFLEEMKKSGMDLNPILLIMQIPSANSIISLNHQNPKEIEENIVHIESGNPNLTNSFIKVLEKFQK